MLWTSNGFLDNSLNFNFQMNELYIRIKQTDASVFNITFILVQYYAVYSYDKNTKSVHLTVGCNVWFITIIIISLI